MSSRSAGVLIWFDECCPGGSFNLSAHSLDEQLAMEGPRLRGAWTYLQAGQLGECVQECLEATEEALFAFSESHGWPAKHTDTIGSILRHGTTLGWINSAVAQTIVWLDEALGRCVTNCEFADDHSAMIVGKKALTLTALVVQLLEPTKSQCIESNCDSTSSAISHARRQAKPSSKVA
jgi:hypothetical protein